MRPFVLALFAAACSAEPPVLVDDTDDPDAYDPSVDPNTPLAVEVGPEGLVLGHAGVRLEVPAGALAEPTTITIAPATELLPEGHFHPATPLWDFGPDGLVFAEPITVEFSVEAASPDLVVHWSTEVGGWGAVPGSEVDGELVRARVTHFSTGFAAPPGVQTEVFVGAHVGEVDVLLVVDASCSMAEEQVQLAAGLPGVVDAFQGTALEWRIGVITPDLDDAEEGGRLREASGARWVEATTPSLTDTLDALVQVGTAGSANEAPLGAVHAAIDGPAEVLTHNQGFYRPAAQLAVITVTDEEDQSAPALTDTGFTAWLTGLKTRPTDARYHAIAGPRPVGCTSPTSDAGPGHIHAAVAANTSGAFASICDADWTPFFDDVVSRVRATECHPLQFEPIPASVHVFLHPSNQALPPEAWIFDEAERCVFLTPHGENLAGAEDFGVRYVPL